MPVVWNPTEEFVNTKMQGSWFSFKPNQRKQMDQDKCNFINTNRQETGLVTLPDQFDPSSESFVEGFEKSQEGMAILGELKERGINSMVNFYLDIVKNNQVSLKRDLAKDSPGTDPMKLAALEASNGEIHAMQLVKKYQARKQDNQAKKLVEVQKLMEEIGPIADT